jgi:two-component sensor histidine kinase
MAVVRTWYKFLRGRLWLNGTFRILPGTPEAYLAAAIFVALASLIRWSLGFVGTPLLPFTAFYPAVLFATYIGGLGAGAFAALLGGLVGWAAFMPPHPLAPGRALDLPLYALACGFLIWGAESYRRLASRLQNEEDLRKLAVEELAHRLKNKIATIQSILSFQLRDQPRIRDTIVARLVALAETDELIMAAQGRGAGIRDILISELEPYELSRVSMTGHDIFLPPRLALTMALLIHEVATNAAKYGALSIAAGKLAICWSVSDGTLSLEWREIGGPPVAAPAHRGFGLRLFSRALDQFNGSVEMSFEEPGLACELKAALPKDMPSLPAKAETVAVAQAR